MSLKGLSDLYIIFLFLDLKIEIERCADPRPSPWELFFWLNFILASNQNPGGGGRTIL